MLAVNETEEVPAWDELSDDRTRLHAEADHGNKAWMLQSRHDPDFTSELSERSKGLRLIAISLGFLGKVHSLDSNNLAVKITLVYDRITTHTDLFFDDDVVVFDVKSGHS